MMLLETEAKAGTIDGKRVVAGSHHFVMEGGILRTLFFHWLKEHDGSASPGDFCIREK